jgi:hypothetical protein
MSLARLAPWLLAVVLLVSGWQYLDARPQTWQPGIIAPDDPVQQELDDAGGSADAAPAGVALRRGDFTALPRARLSAVVRVLSHQRYRFDPIASAVPVDLAVGWGPMSDTAVIDALEISQGARFYTWRYEVEPPLPVPVISAHSANWHIVPASRDVERRLGRVRTGDVIELEGLLVDLKGDDGGSARTSLRRDDTGAGACEIIWVEKLSVRFRH